MEKEKYEDEMFSIVRELHKLDDDLKKTQEIERIEQENIQAAFQRIESLRKQKERINIAQHKYRLKFAWMDILCRDMPESGALSDDQLQAMRVAHTSDWENGLQERY